MRSSRRAKAIAAKRQNYTLTIMWLSFLSVLAVVAMAIASSANAQSKILIRGNGAEPGSLDPHRATGSWENNIIGDMFIGLYTEDVNAKPILGAAESVTTSPDGKTWTFKIRNHTWSDGVPVKASDFVFAFRRILDPKTAAEYAKVLSPIKNANAVSEGKMPVTAVGVKAVDDKTLVIELEKTAPYLPELLTHYTTFPLPEHAVKKFGERWSRESKVSNGPFMLVSWRPNDRVVLTKNPKFYDAANVKLDGVVFFPTQDDDAAFRRYSAGELDMHERWPIAELSRIQKDPVVVKEARKYSYLLVTYTNFNNTRKPFDDVRVRRALAMSVDRQTIADKVFRGALGIPATSFFMPGMANADMSASVDWAKKPYPERVKEAQALMQAAGFGPDKRLKATFNIGSTADARRQAVAIQSMWKQIFVDIDIVAQDTAVHYKTLQTKNYDIGQAGWIMDYNDAKNILYLFLTTTKEQNYSGYANPEFDALMKKSDEEPDAVKRGKILGQMNALLVRDLPAVPNFYAYERKLVKSYVKGFTENTRSIQRSRWMDLAPEALKIQGRQNSLR
jgi:oligopeptide transport system substrate-binding protein